MSVVTAAAVTLRIADSSDALCIAVLGTQVFLDTYATEGIRPLIARTVREHFSLRVIVAEIANPSTTFVVAESSGHMVGFAQLTHGATHNIVTANVTAELDRLYVQERFSGKGIGKLLLHRAEELAASEGATALWLTAWVGNHRALAFYAHRAYTDVGSTVYTFEDEQVENRVFVKELHARMAT